MSNDAASDALQDAGGFGFDNNPIEGEWTYVEALQLIGKRHDRRKIIRDMALSLL